MDVRRLRRWRNASDGAAGAVVLLEVGQWALARAARLPPATADEQYAATPLDERQRRLVDVSLAVTAATPFVFAAFIPTDFGRGAALILLAVAAMPSALGLARVRRHNSWLAIARIPARPRRPKQRPTPPG